MSDKLGEIIKNTLAAIESGKEEIFFIAETSRNETLRLTNELSQLKSDISEIISQVDAQEKVDRQKRMMLMEVNRSFQKYTQKEMIEAYAEAKDAQVTLQLLQSREAQLRKRRDELERSLNQMRATIERAQNLMTQVSMAISLLQGGIEGALNFQCHEQRQELGLRVIKAQEDERRRVAREIHDGPAQTLANIVLRLEIAGKLLEYDPSRVKAELMDLKNLVRANLQDIRRIIFDLRPMALDDLGLIAAISKYLDNFSETYGIECELLIEGSEKRLFPTMEVALFRLIQEGITNVAKHAHSSKVKIVLNFQDDWTSARIQDYGKGFDIDSTMQTPGEHFGLIGMRERVEMFYGRFSLQSCCGEGTIIEFSIPSRLEGGDKP
ncbi:signal transduction histidine-protein kinase/phosphatase DegS [Desulfosporosinus acididurans]|uniref:histidine kinase n=1 Tax=Desulfosporosinus acididurans TaxID=476652 RepID=A0A0J1FWT1_9FIRM|nr:sensor histidine kinase [Desulfosporosinus acididurans]KLU67767.1 signal transduction histidine-protein kinase/phosphatase DegS [Desulfosporosinus acididurans]